MQTIEYPETIELEGRRFVGRFIWDAERPIRERYPEAYVVPIRAKNDPYSFGKEYIDVYQWVDDVIEPVFSETISSKRISEVERILFGKTWQERCGNIRSLYKIL